MPEKIMSNPENQPVLFDLFPSLREKIGWIPLGSFPTPVQRLKEMGCSNLWIKRDDLDSKVYGGNKVRKLEFVLADAIERKKRRVITMGGI
ncbi:MAG: 1-aminocyclopropane-1-carboxylate deaminase, partial [Thermodesulfobacteriota bacterium]|nr:1-aminocyclopropane-1-carboxylate deaminase [Thermodesulfobacteriota bacterium]